MFQVELSLKEPSPFFLINLFLSSLASWLKCYPSRNHKQNLRISTVLLYYSFLPHITIAIKYIQVTCIIDFIYYIKITTYMSILYVHTNYTHTRTETCYLEDCRHLIIWSIHLYVPDRMLEKNYQYSIDLGKLKIIRSYFSQLLGHIRACFFFRKH